MSNKAISSMYLHRPRAPEGMRNKSLGTLFYDTKLVTLRLEGWVFGTINGVGTGMNQYPFISGDLNYRTGTYEKNGQTFINWQWCGFMTTSEREDGKTIYTAVLEIMPVSKESVLWLKLKLED